MAFWKPGSKQPKEDSSSSLKQESTKLNEDDDITSREIVSKLSKGTMSMKFMKRKVDSDQQDRENALKRKLVIDSQWSSEDSTQFDSSTIEAQILHCERDDDDPMAAFPGRRSFRGFNTIVERQYQAALEASKFEHYLDNKKHKEVSNSNLDDEEMAQRYKELVGLPRGPNQGRMSSNNKPVSRKSK